MRKVNFTIITVVKNDEKNIKKTLKNVLNQTYKNFEYIIVDGKSTDHTLNILKEYKKKYDFILYSREDLNFYDSLNFAIKKSKGNYIGIMNSGDVFINKNQLKKINDKLNKNYFIFYSNLYYVRKGKYVRSWEYSVKKLNSFNIFKIPHSTLFVHKKLYENLGLYNLKYKISSDLDFLIRLQKKISFIQHLNFRTINMSYGGLSTNLKSYKTKLNEDFKILFNHFSFLFPIFYFFKIFFKFKDFKIINLFKSRI